ncbi:hypothetical protein ACSBOB_15900 [Mesorhizobium sp. ASY16-5R]|uniref:hypothetical protein n=1 Tax=Mesorhizobium sp. ASY16-5R TaxID=3445772 RepID=UPI003F9EEA3C
MVEATYTELATGGFLDSIEIKSDSVRFNFILARRGWNLSVEFFIDFQFSNSLNDGKDCEFDIARRSGAVEQLWRLIGLQIGRFTFRSDEVAIEFASEHLNSPFVRAAPSVGRGFPEQVVFRIHEENVFDHVP